MSMGLDKEDLLSMSRVKGKLGIIFLSDMTTADGKHLEVFVLEPKEQDGPQNKFIFPKRNSNRSKLGGVEKLLAPAHRREIPATHTEDGTGSTREKNNCLRKRNGSGTKFYVPTGNARTRSGSQYIKVGSGPEELSKRAASVQVLEGAGVKLRCSGPPLTAKLEDPREFWDHLTRQGGTWM